MGEDGNSWQQVNVRVKESTYEEDWKPAAKSEYAGMSDLVRTAVRREIDGDHDRQSGDGGSSEVVTEVAEAIDSLENTVRDIDTRLTVVRETVESSGPEFSFKAAVRETVPHDGGLTAGQIAARLDARESDVQDALDELDGIDVHEHYEQPDQDEPIWQRMGGE